VLRSARLLHMAYGSVLGCLLFAVVVVAVLYWVNLEMPWATGGFALLVCGFLVLRQRALERWRRRLNQSGARERIGQVLIGGPEYINGIFSYTPRAFWFMLGPRPTNISSAVRFVSHNLGWFIQEHPIENRPASGMAAAFAVMALFGLARLCVDLAGYGSQYSESLGGTFPVLSLILLFGLGFYFVHLVERQVTGLRWLSDLVDGLAGS